MTTPSKSQTDIPSVDGLNTVTPETINEAALQYVYAVGDLDTADEAVAAEPETPVDPIMTIMPVGEAIIIEEPEAIAADNSFIEDAPADLIWIMPSEEAYADGEVYEDVLVDELIDSIFTIMPVDESIITDEVLLDETVDAEVIETPPEDITDVVSVDPIFTIMPVDDYIFLDDMATIPEAPRFYEENIDGSEESDLETSPEDMTDLVLVDPIFTIMPVDESIIIDEVLLDETVDAEVIETPPEDITDVVLIDPIFTIMPVDDYIFLDDMATIPKDCGFYEGVIDLVADTHPLDLSVMEKPFILDWSPDRGDEGSGDIALDNLDIQAPEQTLVSTWIMCTFTSEDIVFSTEEPVADKGFADIDAGAATEITLLGLAETIEFIA